MYYEDGGQRSTTPSCGTRLFIRKDALLLHYTMTEEVTVTTDTITTLYSDISFDGDGFVTRMESMYP